MSIGASSSLVSVLLCLERGLVSQTTPYCQSSQVLTNLRGVPLSLER